MLRKVIILCEEVTMTRKVLVNLVILFGLTSFAAAKTIYVPGEDYAAIQYAIDDPCTADGDEIVVGLEWADPDVPEVYVAFDEGNRDIDFRGKAITVRSRYGAAYCIIDCGGSPAERHRAFRFHSGETKSSVVRGFTIKNGYAYFGGAIECTYSSPEIRDCIIYDNYASHYGGGIECYLSSPEIFNCLFYNNRAGGYGGAIDCEGEQNNPASPKIFNCTFDKNHADINGGGIFSGWNSKPDVLSCIFTRCSNHAIHEILQDLDSDVFVMTSLFFENRINPNDPGSDLADYYDADTATYYAGKYELEHMPVPPGELKNIYTVYDNNPRFVTGPAGASLPEPLGDYYLRQQTAGQLPPTSICVDRGQWEKYPSGQANPFYTDPEYTYTTRTDNVGENTSLDIGYHYRVMPVNEYYLVTEVTGGNGNIDPCHPSPGTAYNEFSQVRLNAIPDEGYAVSWWSGTENDFNIINQYYPQGITEKLITITADSVVTVGFELRQEYQLTTVVDGVGGSLTPASGLQYAYKKVNLVAEPWTGYTVRKWQGTDHDDSIDLTNTVTMDGDKEVHVEFITDYLELTVLSDPTKGTVIPRRGSYEYMEPVTLTVTIIDPNYRVDGYQVNDGDLIIWHENVINLTMDEDKIVEVFFETAPRHPLTINYLQSEDGLFHGSVQMLPAQPDNGYLEGTQVQLLPVPEAGYEANWLAGVDSVDQDGAWVTMTGPRAVWVRFEIIGLPDDYPVYVYPGIATGEPDWAAGPKDSDPCTPGIQGYNTIQDAIDDPCTITGIYGPYVVVGDPEATPLPIPDIPEAPGDVVVVADGVHTGPGNRDLDFKGKLITVRSEFGPENCIIDCGGSPAEPHRGFIFADVENNAAVVDGFTIINGYADYGGAIYIGGISRPIIRNCIIGTSENQNNSAGLGGGGVCFEGLEEDDSTYQDLADEAEAIATELEAEITDPGTDPNGEPLPPDPEDVVDALVARLVAIMYQQIADSIDDEEADRPTLTNCKILYNKAGEMQPGNGGGIYCLNSNPIIMNTEIHWNTAGIAPPGLLSYGFGGGVYCEASAAAFINCLVLRNHSSEAGGAFYLLDGSDAVIRLCTVAHNISDTIDSESSEPLDGIVANESDPEINHCIIYHVADPCVPGDLGGVDLFECDADPAWVEDDNLFQSPMWVTGPFGDYYLSQPLSATDIQTPVSPCFDAGDTGVLQELEDDYGLPFDITTRILNYYDLGNTDFGYHYPFNYGPPIKYWLTLRVFGNGILYYSAQDIGVYPPVDPCGIVTPFADVQLEFTPGTTVTLMAYPEPGYRVYEWVGTDNYPSYSLDNQVTVYGHQTVDLFFEEEFPSTWNVPKDFAYNEIHLAIDAARDGDIIVIEPGTYPGTGYMVWGKNITITAEFPLERDDPTKATIIDCSGETEGGFHLIGTEQGTCILNGLVIQTSTWVYGGTGYDGDEIEDDLAGTPGQPGGTFYPGGLPIIFQYGPTGVGTHYQSYYPHCGISIFGNHTVANCTVRGFDIRGGDGGDGQAGDEDIPLGGYGGDGGSAAGAGIFIGVQYDFSCPYGWQWFYSSPLIIDSIVEDCTVVGGDAGAGAEGGYEVSDGGRGGLAGMAEGAGIYIDAGNIPTFKNCIIRNCRSIGGYGGDGGDGGDDGGWGGYGGLTSYDPAQPHPSTRTARGAGVYCEAFSVPSFIDCLFEDNFADGSVSGVGGIHVPSDYQSQPRNNYKIPSYGSGVFGAGASDTTFTNCIVRNNETVYGYGEGLLGNEQEEEPGEAPELEEWGGTAYSGYGGGICLDGIVNYYTYTVTGTFEGLPLITYTFWSEEVPAVATVTNCRIGNNSAPIGGGIYSKGSDVDVTDSDFIENSSYVGGGLLSTHGLVDISGCTIRGNIASITAAPEAPEDPEAPDPLEESVGIGGGLYCFTTAGSVSDSVVTENLADVSGGGVYLGGEPRTLTRWNTTATPELVNCLITDNSAGASGGGVACNILVEAQIANCTISDNKLTDPNSHGGGLYAGYDSEVDVIDSILWANDADYGAQLAVDGFWIDVNDTPIYFISKANVTYTDIGPPYEVAEVTFTRPASLFTGGSTGGEILVEPQIVYDQYDAGAERVKVIVSLIEPAAMRQATDWDWPESIDALRDEIWSRQDAVLSTLTSTEFTLRHRFDNQAGFSGEITVGGLNKLLNNPAVEHVEPAKQLHKMLAQAIPLANATGARQVYDGSGIAVAIVDTGVDYRHPRLGGGGFPNSKVIGGYDTGEDDADPMAVGEAHGTCCAGIAAGDLGTVGDYIGGVAPGAKIYALKAAPDNAGFFWDDDLVAAWDWCVTHRNDDPANPIMAMSNSLGSFNVYNDPADAEADDPALTIAANTATAAGITVLAASGNSYATDGISSPAAIGSIISVGAVYDTTDEVTEYSNTSEILDILAPADPVYTTDIVGPDGYDLGDYYPYFDGTSSACPFAAGSVASIQSAALDKMGRYLTPDEVREALTDTGDPVTDTKVDITKPRVNLGAAIDSIGSGPPVWVADGCRLNDVVFYDFDPNTFRWNPAARNIQDDPLFVGDYFLSQIAGGQLVDSNCVDAGSDLAANLGMNTYTTMTNSGLDASTVDMGYHHKPFTVPQYKLRTRLISAIGGDIDPNHPTGDYYDQYTVVPLRIWPTPPPGYRVKWSGSDDDRSTALTNTVTMDRDRTVVAEFEQYWYTLKIVIEGPGRVTADSNSVPYNDNYPPGAVVYLTADPNEGYRVRLWQDADTDPQWGGNTAKVTMSRNRTVIVEFEPDVSDNLLVPLEYATIEEAVDAASNGDIIILQRRDTPYTVSDPCGIDFGGRAITIMSEYPNEPNCAAGTVIDCQGSRFFPKRAFYFHSGEGPDSRIWGITIKNGFMPGDVGGSGVLPGYIINPGETEPIYSARLGAPASGDGYGGAILCENGSSPTIENCVITNCSATGGQGGDGDNGYYVFAGMEPPDGQWGGHAGSGFGNGHGGAIACRGGSRGGSNPAIINCIMSNNTTRGGCGGNGGNGSQKDDPDDGNESWGGNGGHASGEGFGGAIYCDGGSNPAFVDCTFRNNIATSARSGQGGLVGPGNALDPPAANGVRGTNTTSGVTAGGAIYYGHDSDPNFINCKFLKNEAYDIYMILRYAFGETGVYGYVETPIYTTGGALYSEPNNVVNLKDCDFIDQLGGAVYCERNCTLDIANGLFIKNQSRPQIEDYSLYYGMPGYFFNYDYYYDIETAPGGAIHANSSCKVNIDNCDFMNNYTHGDGGAVHSKSSAVVTDCTFGGNRAQRKGGAVGVYLLNSSMPLVLDFEGCSFGGNEAASGGAVSLRDVDATFADCYFAGNRAQSGGGLFVVDGALVLKGGFISENQAKEIVDTTTTTIVSEEAGCGGGLACITSSATIADCVISDNLAEGTYSYGGGVSFYGGSNLITHEVKNCLITGNSAGTGGGGISGRIFTSPQIANCTFEGNSAGSYGGGIYSDWTSSWEISDTIFENCNKKAIYKRKIIDDTLVQYSLFYDNPNGDYYDAGTGLSYTFSKLVPDDYPPGVGVLDEDDIRTEDPVFVTGSLGDYYLDQSSSAAVDEGSDLAANLGMNTYTTDPDPNGTLDTGKVDIGYHYGHSMEVSKYVIEIVMPDGHGWVQAFYREQEYRYYGTEGEPPLKIEASLGAMITINAYPDVGYRLASWSGGTVNDQSKELTNVVIVTYQKTIEVRFEQPRTLFVGTVTGDEAHYTSIQHAIDDAVDGDVVIILPGEYIPAPPGASPYDDIRLYNKDITLTTSYSENPDDVVLRGYDFYIYDTGPGATIEGFTLTGGRMFLYRSSPTIRNCKFRDTNWFGVLPETPEGCAQDGVDGVDIYGGAIAMYGSSPDVLNCTFEDVSVTGGPASGGNDGCEEHPGGGDGGWPGRGYGGAVYCTFSSNPTFVDCLFADCYAAGGIGGNGGAGNEDPAGHGGRGGGWEYAPSIEDDPAWWYWWDGWTYGDKYLMWYSWGYNNYDWEKWGEWFDTSSWINWEDWYTDYYSGYMAGIYTYYGQYTPYDAYEDYWEYSGYGGAVYCEYDSSPKFSGCIFDNNYSSGGISGIGALGGLNGVWPVPDRNLNIETAGGAVYAANGSNPKFEDCLFVGNIADPNTIAAIGEGGEGEPGEEEESPYENVNDDYYVSYGGAVAHEDGCAPKFTNCRFEDNESCQGGALYVGGSHMTVADCDFVDNTAYHGAGLFTVSTTGTVSGSVFTGNTARFDPVYVTDPCNPGVALVPIYSQGGGYCSLSSPVDIRDSVFMNNSSMASGGGIYYAGSDENVFSAPALSNCLLANNTAGLDGGGVSSNWYTEPVISNSTIADNMVTGGTSGPGSGSGLYCSYYSNVTVIDSIIWGNVGVSGAQITLNSGNEYAIQPSTLEIKYSDIAGGWTGVQKGQGCELTWGEGNINDDPLFVANEDGDYYYLSQTDSGQPSESPCVDAGSRSAKNIGLHIYTTRTNNSRDDYDLVDPNSGIVDMGYHYPLIGAALESCSLCDLAPPRQSKDSVRLYGDGIINLSDLAVVTLYWYESCESDDPSLDWCSGFTFGDYTVGFRELTTIAKCWLEEDDQGPQPDPSQWEQEPYSDSSTSITMTAKVASDNWVEGDVQYYFEEISDNSGGSDSDWQESPTYLDEGLTPGTEYTYRVRTRDNKLPQPYMTEWSEERTAAASADMEPPSPVAWDQEPYEAGGTSISMSAQIATDAEGSIPVQYYFDCTTPGGNDSGWQNDPCYTDIGLAPDTEYCYLLGVRDGSLNESWIPNEEEACATTGMVNWPPYPDADGAIPGVTPANWDPDAVEGWTGQPRSTVLGHYMRADAAVDYEGDGVEYYFECVSGEISDSGWRRVVDYGDGAREYTFMEAPAGTNYCYRVFYRDSAVPPAVSNPSSTLCVP